MPLPPRLVEDAVMGNDLAQHDRRLVLLEPAYLTGVAGRLTVPNRKPREDVVVVTIALLWTSCAHWLGGRCRAALKTRILTRKAVYRTQIPDWNDYMALKSRTEPANKVVIRSWSDCVLSPLSLLRPQVPRGRGGNVRTRTFTGPFESRGMASRTKHHLPPECSLRLLKPFRK